jgi:2-polyprenyl-6-methoxyphenol hydroxylase-like FAD-dependent oxidoreductase
MRGAHAVVVGGSVAGLCAARVLAGVYDRVTVVERDALPDGTTSRPGVPQARHVHALLVRGRRELERLFPGFDAAMRAAGAQELDFARDFATLRPQGWGPRVDARLPTLYASRGLLERVVRDLLRRQTPVTLRDATVVEGLVLDGAAPAAVRGVRVRRRDGGAPEALAATLVVDASGRGSRVLGWLEAAGIPPPAEDVVDPYAAYATRWYQAPPPASRPAEWWWRGVWIDPVEPHHPTAAVLFPVEDDRWIVTVAGFAGRQPPTDVDGFTTALERLRSPIIADAVRHAAPLSPVHGYGDMRNRFRHFERWPAAPRGLLAAGDAVCAFNPVYGQGMTCAAVSATLLRATLAALGPDHPELPTRFFATQAGFLRDPWDLATGADFRFGTTAGPRPALAALLRRLADGLFEIATDDPDLLTRVGEVLNLVRPVRDLFLPDVAPLVAAGALRRALRPRRVLRQLPAVPAP